MIEVSIKQIDNLSHSVKVGKNLDGQRMVARFDKISFVSTCNAEYLKLIYGYLEQMMSNDIYSVTRYTPTGDMRALYRSEILIQNKKDRRQYLVINYGPRGEGRRGEFRFEFSPQHYSKKEINDLFMWLGNEEQLGKHLFELLKSAWVTRIDFALDTYGLDIDDYLIHLKSASKGVVHTNSDGEHGINLGSNDSEVYASIYPKKDVGKNIKYIDEEVDELSTVMLDIGQYLKFLRIELRYQPEKQKLLLSKLNNIPNLFEKLIFIDSNVKSELSALVPEYQKLTLPEIRAQVKAVYPAKVLKRLDRLLVKNRVELIDHKQVWDKLHLVVDKLGILGNDALWQKNLREKWARKHGYK